jgi:ubiquinone biosynthesis protein UbiJ
LFKNILGNVDIDWEEELALFIPRSVVRRLLQLAEQAKDRKEQLKEQLDELSVDFLEERNIPRQPGLESLRTEVVDLSEQVQKLERRIDRLINRMGIAAAARSPRDKSTTSGS